MPSPGEFNALVRFDQRGPDANGDPLGDWLPGFEVWAKVEYLRGSESAIANRIEGRQPVTMVIHDQPDAQDVRTGWRAVIIEGRGVRAGDAVNINSVAPAQEIGFLNLIGIVGGATG
jgi:head-tail adaptor